ncbi:MAG: hypothetical protein Q9195_005846 [Heterodermia aff. obscurata]
MVRLERRGLCRNILTWNGYQGLVIPILPFALGEIADVLEQDLQQWTSILLAAYGAGAIIGAPITSFWAERSGSRRTVFFSGLIALAASMVAFSIGRSMIILIVGRFIQGASAASVTSVGIAIAADAFTDQGMGLLMGVIELSMALGTISGPVVGGLLYHYNGYRFVFLSAYILIALDLAFRLVMLERNREDCLDPRNHSPQPRLESPAYIDYSQRGSIDETSSIASSYSTYGAILNDSSSVTDVSLSASPSVTSTRDVMQDPLSETSSEPQHSPMIELLLTPRMQVCLLGDFMYNVILNGLESVLPLQIKMVFGYNSKEVALILLMLAIPSFGGLAVGYLGDKFGPRRLVCLGFAGLAPLLVSLRIMGQPNFDQVILLCTLLFMIGGCLTLVITPLFMDVTYLVDERAARLQHCGTRPKKAYAQAYAMMSVACACGSLCGPLLGGLVDYLGWRSWTLGAGFLCALTSLPCILFLGGKPKLGHRDQ